MMSWSGIAGLLVAGSTSAAMPPIRSSASTPAAASARTFVTTFSSSSSNTCKIAQFQNCTKALLSSVNNGGAYLDFREILVQRPKRHQTNELEREHQVRQRQNFQIVDQVTPRICIFAVNGVL